METELPEVEGFETTVVFVLFPLFVFLRQGLCCVAQVGLELLLCSCLSV
jgi:uncharacterized membrane protein YqaE (UPF0057 family)